MSHASIKRGAVAGIVVLIVGLSFPERARASDIILPGFDLLDPLPGTVVFLPGLGLVPFVGVPLGTFPFDTEPLATGNADTIIERLAPVVAPPAGTEVSIPIVLRAMQLVSEIPIDIGFGLDFHFLTLQAGMPSTGTMIFTEFSGPHGPPPPPHGFARYEAISWFFDVRQGSLDGPVRFSTMQVLSSAFSPWSHFAPTGSHLLAGFNHMLGGMPCVTGDDCSDFFFLETFSLTSIDGTEILSRTATVPEPAMMVLVGMGLAAFALRARRQRRQVSCRRPPATRAALSCR